MRILFVCLGNSHSDDLIAQGAGTATALVDGYQVAFLVGAGFIAAALAIAVAVLKPVPALAAAAEPAAMPEFEDGAQPALGEAA